MKKESKVVDMSTEIADYSTKKKSGCGILVLYNGVFGVGRRLSVRSRRTSSTSSIPAPSTLTNSKPIRRSGSDQATLLDTSNVFHEPIFSKLQEKEKPFKEAILNPPKTSSSSSSNGSSTTKMTPTHVRRTSSNSIELHCLTTDPPRAHVRRVSSNSIELHSLTNNPQRTKGSSPLVRSSTAMVISHLGNIIPPSTATNVSSNVINGLDNKKYGNGNVRKSIIVGNIARRTNPETRQPSGYLRNSLSRRMDPEELKVMGNEEYKKGRFAEALTLYDRAIALEPNKASYRSNKSAALTGLGRLLEAVFECREAIRIEPFYHRAHHRLATLYLRLGETQKALYHLEQSGPEAKPFEIVRAKALESQVDKCNEARKVRDWNRLLNETKCAISMGADSALQIFSVQAEALLKLHRHEDADAILRKTPVFHIDECTKFFGPIGNAQMLVVRAQVDMAAGRFEEAVEAAKQASRLDLGNKEVSWMVRRTRAVALARSTGNHLYNASKFSEASMAYTEGLEHDSFNSVLLCNRAACRFKLGQFEKALEDCTNALNLRPSYTKARLRRANCNAKMERWEASIQDYETLIRESPGDDEVGRALFEAQVQLKKQRGEDVTGMKFSADVVVITNNERFRHYVTSAGMSVVLFSNKWSDKQALHLMNDLSKRYTSVNFLKVEVQEHPYLAKSEGVRSTPAFKIYKNGSRVKDLPGNNEELLENSLKFYITSI